MEGEDKDGINLENEDAIVIIEDMLTPEMVLDIDIEFLQEPTLPKKKCYFMYFKDNEEVAIFKNSMEERNKIEEMMGMY
jgi:hypothetical protein